MKIIDVIVNKQQLTVRAPCELVAGTVGLYGVKVTYDEEWDATPHRLILFDGCKEIKLEDRGEVVTVPHECIEKPCYLKFGLLGMDGNGEIRITTYSDSDNKLEVLPKDWKGEAETDEPLPKPTPSEWERLHTELQRANDLNANYAKVTNELLGIDQQLDAILDKQEAYIGGASE